MTGRDLCDHCDGSGYADDEGKKVCEECGGDGIQW